MAILAGIAVGRAAAEPPQPTAPAGALPNGFPGDLRQFVGGTEEFKSGPWFSGDCAKRGGDVGRYINDVFAAEDRLLYWAASDNEKKGLHSGGAPTGLSGRADISVEPPKSSLPRVFPAGAAAFHMPSSTCADDLKRWTSAAWNPWGFDWAKTPDQQSMRAIARLGDEFAAVPSNAWTDPCAVGGPYCAHAYFANCDQADVATGDQTRCLEWNTAVGRLYEGTAHWIEQNTSFSDRIGAIVRQDANLRIGAAVTKAFGWLWDKAATAAKFIVDPQSAIDDWANSSKDGAVELSSRVLDGLAATGHFDPTAPWFLRWYAISTGIGVMVMGLMTLMALWRAGSRGETMKSIGADLVGYLPAGVLMMLFAPSVAALLVQVASGAADAIARTAGPDMGQTITDLQHFTGELTAATLPGGALIGLLLFLLLIVCALAVYFGLLMHQVALPCLAVACGIGFGMWVHPGWRKKALRPVLLFIAIVASKPLLFLLLATITGVMDSGLADHSAGAEKLGALGRLCLVVVAFAVAGLAPWSLLRYAPLLPSRSDAAGFGQSSSLLAGAVGGVGTAMWWSGRGGGGRGSTQRPLNTHTDGESGGMPRDPGWRTSGSEDGRSPTEAKLGTTLARNTGGESSTKQGIGAAGGIARRAASGTLSASMAAVPIAAQAASGVLNKARSVAESAPGEAESE
ncbi:hypothetical protein D5S18_34200 [Nocardia panacis]|uniref:Uncharacterized protein n=2 Tax=Nocardia panacis TaxID=2340916 RepID=A0A3A4JY15_9NOCA|nr:hypothetical protein D5S18_34200 [Nocardia panacis]